MDKIWKIQLNSIGYYNYSTNKLYGQEIFLDNVRLFKGQTEPSTNCTERGKKCCASGFGNGNYYGEQLSCNKEGESCYDSCFEQKTYTLEEFIEDSNNDDKYNKTEGDCQFVDSDGEIIKFKDYIDNSIYPDLAYCYDGESDTNVGAGYTACIDDSEDSCGREDDCDCEDWDNVYTLDLEDTELEVPDTNGTYKLKVIMDFGFTNSSEEYESLILSEMEGNIIVGSGTSNYSCLDSSYSNFTYGDWSDCIDNYKTRIKTGYYIGTYSCPSIKNFTETEQCVYSSEPESSICTEYDWQCDSWGECFNGYQSRNCDLINQCDTNSFDSYIPEQDRECSESSPINNSSFNLKWILYAFGAILLGIIVFLIIKFVSPSIKNRAIQKKDNSNKKIDSKYPELYNYIKDALTSGMQTQEIKSKLIEAGWPKDIVEGEAKKFK